MGGQFLFSFFKAPIRPSIIVFRDFVELELTRTDFLKGGTIKTSLNLPAQSFYQSRKTLLDLCDRASIRHVIFYCGKAKAKAIIDFHRNHLKYHRFFVRQRSPLCRLDARLHRRRPQIRTQNNASSLDSEGRNQGLGKRFRRIHG